MNDPATQIGIRPAPSYAEPVMKLLLIADETELAQSLCHELAGLGYSLDRIGQDTDVLRFLAREKFDVLLRDVAADELPTFATVQRLRQHGWSIPLIVLLTNDKPAIRIQALEAGADDVASKPLVYAELDARIKALLRRAKNDGLQMIKCGLLSYDMIDRLFHLAGTALNLTPREHAVLETLVTQPGRVVRKQTIHHKVYSLGSDASPEAIEIYVHRLRRRLDGHGVRIVTVRGYGYRIEAGGHADIRRRSVLEG